MAELKTLLENSHKDLHQWFLCYQECILLGFDDMAQSSLAIFSQFTTLHLSFEEDYLLSDANLTLQWPLRVYKQEHDKILKKLDGLIQATFEYSLMTGRHKRLAMLNLIEAQQRFYRLLEHHEEREEADLFLVINQGIETILWTKPYTALVNEHGGFKKTLLDLLADT